MCRKFLLPNLFLFSLLFFHNHSLFAQSHPWTTKADIPTPRWFLSSSTVNGKVYAIGGIGNSNKVEEYDPASDTWTTKANMPTGRGYLATGVVNGKIYAFGGTNHCCPPGSVFAITEEYDPATNTWTTKANMPTPKTGICAGVVDEKIYVIGGRSTIVEMYDPATDTWTAKQDMLTARGAPTCSVVDGKIYVFGGFLATNAVEMYDPATDTWTPKAHMPGPRVGHASAVVNGKVYIFGGTTGSGGLPPYANLWVYDPATDTWDTSFADMPFDWFVMGYGVVNDCVYLMAGSGVPYPHGDNLHRVAEYIPHNDLSYLDKNVDIDKYYAIPGVDTILITSRISDPSGITLFAEIEAPDQTPFDSLQLFDDGNHNDGSAGDTLFANSWPVPPVVENNYYIDLQVTRVDTDTIVHEFNNMAVFTTIGPVVFDNYRITSSDTIPHNTNNLKFEFTLGNDGSTANALNISSQLAALDTFSIIPLTTPEYGDIQPGSTAVGNRKQYIKFDLGSEDSIDVKFRIDISSNGYLFWSDTFSVFVYKDPTGIDTKDKNLPKEFALNQNYPNPFNPSTTIEFSIPKTEFVTLKIYNLLGQEVATLVSEKLMTGSYKYTWDAGKLASGIYYYQFKSGEFVRIRKMILIK